ncbi:MAG: WG repeat-containing protein, partial [Candidatus Zixiibacteriota bacterium]
ASRFAEGLAAVLIDGKMGFIDDSGEVAIEPAYDFAQDFSEGLAAVSVDGLIGFIDPSGQMVIEPRFDFAESFSEGLAAARDEELIGFIDSSGQMVIAPQFDEAGPFQDGLARVESAHRWGAIDQTGTPLFQLPVSAVSPTSTLIIPFIPGVPAETRDGICLKQLVSSTEPSGWRCIVEAETSGQFAKSYPCLLADDGQSLVCQADPLVGDPGFRVNLVEPLLGPPIVSSVEMDSSNRAWLVQLADGAICRPAADVRATIEGQRANYTCSDSSVLLGELRPGPVWQADRVALTDINPTAAGYMANQISPVAIAVVWQPVDPAAVLAEIGLSATAINIDPTGVAETIAPQIRPAMPATPDAAGEPAHLRFAFDNEDLPEGSGVFSDQAQLLIYPVAAYREASADEVGRRVEALQALLQDRPESADDELPVLPDFGEAEQTLQAQLKYLDFDGGAGVRFITHYGVDAAPITDHGTFYTFQGLTDDGQFVIVFFHPAPTELLPGDSDEIAALIEDRDAFAENFETYLQEISDRLNQAEPTDFAPDLTDLDAMLESIQIQPEPKRVWVHQVEIEMVDGEYVATIVGDFPDSCSTLGDVETAVEGDTIAVTVYADSPPDVMCASVLIPFVETITLDLSEIEPGDYTVVVNEFATTTLTIN